MIAADSPRYLSLLVHALVRWRYVLALVALCSLPPAWLLARQLKFDQSIESLYASDNPQLQQFRQSREWFGGDEFVIVAWRDPQLLAEGSRELTPEAEIRIRDFSQKLSLVPGVNPDSTQDLARLHREQMIDFGLFRRSMTLPRDRMHDLMRKTLLSEDDQTTAIILRLRPLAPPHEREQRVPSRPTDSPNEAAEEPNEVDEPDEDDSQGLSIAPTNITRRATISRIRDLARAFGREHGLEVAVAGEPVQVDDMFRYVEDDGRTLFRVSLVLLAGVLFLLFRSLRWVLLPLVIVVAAILWTEATLVLVRVPLSMVSSMLNSLVTIIGIATVTHFAVRLRDRLQSADTAGMSRVEVVSLVCRELIPPVFWTCTTTAAGFGALLTSSIAPVQSFALMMTLATGCVFLAVLMLVPVAMLAGRNSRPAGGGTRQLPAGELPAPAHSAPAPSATGQQGASYRLARRLAALATYVDRRHQRVAIAAAVVSIVALAGFLRLEVETDFSRNFRKDSPIVESLNFVETHLGGAGSWELNFPAPQRLNSDYLEKVEQLEQRLREKFVKQPPPQELTKIVGIPDGMSMIFRIPFLTASVRQRTRLLNQVQPEFLPSLYRSDAGRMRIVLRSLERQNAEDKLKTIERVRQVARQWAAEELREEFPAAEVQATGLFVLLANLIDSLLRDQLTSFVLAACGIFVMMSLAFRSIKFGLIGLVPNFFPIVFVIGCMGWSGLPVNIATAMIASVSMGLTVDSSVHYLTSYRRWRQSGLSRAEAVRQTHAEVGRALVFANIALVVGFSVLALSHFIPLVYFGLLVSIAMLGGLAGNLLLLPVFLRWLDHDEPATRATSSADILEQPVAVK